MRSQLGGGSLVRELCVVMPGELGVIVVANVVSDYVSLRHQQLKVARVAPVTLDQHRITGHAGDLLAVREEWEGTVPFSDLAVEKPEIQRVRFTGNDTANAYHRFKVAMHAVALEATLEKRDAGGGGWSLIGELRDPMPGQFRIVVVAEIVSDQIALRDQQLEVALAAPIALNEVLNAVKRRDTDPNRGASGLRVEREYLYGEHAASAD